MKPQKLTISAFGSFAGKETLDFTRLGPSGLYLVYGRTGSGKTTIFDAISFALFGEASGRTRDRQMFRSDFADQNAKTFVDFEFTSAGHRYHIQRVVKKTGQDAVLELPDGPRVTGIREVNAKMAEIVGLDRNQFSQIVMIAQNDFLRFLQSGTEDRVAILRRIFNTEKFKSFQDKLKARAKMSGEKLMLIRNGFDQLGVNPHKREEQLQAWETQHKSDKESFADLETRLAELDKKKTALTKKIALAGEFAKKFADLDTTRTALAEHGRKAEEILLLSVQRDRGSLALRKVKPSADRLAETNKQYEKAKRELVEAVSKSETAAKEAEDAKKAFDILPLLDETQTAFDQLKKEWENAAVKDKKLAALQADYDTVAEQKTSLDATRKELNALEETIKTLPSLETAREALAQLKRRQEQAIEKRKKLDAMQAEHTIIETKQASLKKSQSELETLGADFKEKDERYKILYEAFLRAQAGILAGKLTEGEACPVCGATEHPAPAKLSGEDVTEAKFRDAEAARDRSRKKCDDKAKACGTLKAELGALVEHLFKDLPEYAPGVVWENAGKILADLPAETKTEIDTLDGKVSADEKKLAELGTLFETSTKKRGELSSRCTELNTEIATRTVRLLEDFSEFLPDRSQNLSWDTVSEMLPGMSSQTRGLVGKLTEQKESDERALAELVKKRENATKRKVAAEASHQSALTLVKERRDRESESQKRERESRTAFLDALNANGFLDEATYRAALVTEEALDSMTKRIDDYGKAKDHLTGDIARLEQEIAGKEKPDPGKLTEESDALKALLDEVGKNRDEINMRLVNTAKSLDELRRLSKKYVQSEAEYAALKQLSDTANAKLDFETYAQMAYFERVLHAANQRLNMMSQNRYSLLRKSESDDARKRTGLDIEVFDAYTGKARSAKTLSGGESFMASLSLALGLSDVVQENAGGVHLDAMFIDEGFGSLDTETLDLAVRTLSDMAGGTRIIGIISHVAELGERIDKQVLIEKTPTGSRIRPN